MTFTFKCPLSNPEVRDKYLERLGFLSPAHCLATTEGNNDSVMQKVRKDPNRTTFRCHNMEQFNGVQWLDESNTIQLVCTDGIQQWDTTIATHLKRWDAALGCSDC